jgi:DNA-3-methyladenine glycosylase I
MPGDELYEMYHDSEWGVPVHDDRVLYEFLVLEAFQAGLSWRTVLHKRKNFQKAFAKFDPKNVARFTQRDVKRLLNDVGIIRNRAKIEAAINNAQKFLEVQKEFGSFDRYARSWKKGMNDAIAWSKDLKKRGFKFLGPTVVYAFMQAVGMVNDHDASCYRHTRRS